MSMVCAMGTLVNDDSTFIEQSCCLGSMVVHFSLMRNSSLDLFMS